jgi:adenine phosphoribosyltransferase
MNPELATVPMGFPALDLDLPSMSDLAKLVRNVPDWPKPGIQFKDITPLLSDPAGLKQAIDDLAEPFRNSKVELVLGTEARGFLFAPAVALALGAGVVLARKPGKLPWKTLSESYALEYGTDALEVHQDAVKPGQKVLLVDDLLATGGTMLAAAKLVETLGGVVVGCAFLIELSFLPGRERLSPRPIHSLIQYHGED